MKNTILILAAFGLLVLSGCEKKTDAGQAPTAAQTAPAAEALQTAEPVAVALPKLLDLGADQCIPCKMMVPVLEELSKTYQGKLDVEFIDVWKPENQEKAKAYGIESIPTQIFFDSAGKELWRHVGFISTEDILKKWQEFGYGFEAAAAQE